MALSLQTSATPPALMCGVWEEGRGAETGAMYVVVLEADIGSETSVGRVTRKSGPFLSEIFSPRSSRFVNFVSKDMEAFCHKL